MDKRMYKLEYLRKRRGFSRYDMAKFLGMTIHGYRKIEVGERRLSLEVAQQLVKILGVQHIEDLLDEAI